MLKRGVTHDESAVAPEFNAAESALADWESRLPGGGTLSVLNASISVQSAAMGSF